MTPSLRVGLVGVFLVIGFAQPGRANAYELRTHGEVTRAAYKKSESLAAYLSVVGIHDLDRFDPAAATDPKRLALFENIGTALDWMIEGSIREDEYVENLLLILAGCPRPANPSETSRILNHFHDVQRGGRGLTGPLGQLGFPALDWALGRQGRGTGPKENQFSLPDAREYQYQSLTAPTRDARDKFTARFFRTLGHVLHIVEDMAQPQHTRNDPHAGCMSVLDPVVGGHSWYEHYVEDRTLRRAFPRGNPPPELVLGDYEVVPIRSYQEFFTDSRRRGMADFSSRNFLSAGTNLPSCDGLTEPPCEVTAYQQVTLPYSANTLKGPVMAPVTLYTHQVVDALTGEVIPRVPLTSRSLWDQYLGAIGKEEKFSLNRFNLDAMADILLPRAVGYAAGFLDSFFRGFIGATYENQAFRIWGAAEPMVGDFQLLYDDAGGTRRQLASWSLSLEPDGLSSALTTPQLSPETPQDTPCWLVFRGQLGAEAGAVAGAAVPCPFAPTPPSSGTWTLYNCLFTNFATGMDERYVYATPDPPIATDGLPEPRLSAQSSAGFTRCTILTWGLASQPPNTRTQHPT